MSVVRGLLACAVVNVVSADAFISECGGTRPSQACVHRALKLDGAVALDVPGLASARRQALTATAKCLTVSALSSTTLPDGTSRATVGSRTRSGLSEPLEGCTEAEDATAAMRSLVNDASRRFLDVIQPLMRRGGGLLRADGAAAYMTLSDVSNAGEHLEHFHVYRPRNDTGSAGRLHAEAVGTPDAVPLHTDAGLFIAIVPALRVVASGAGGFAPLAEAEEAEEAEAEAEAEEAEAEAAGVEEGVARDGFYVQRWDGSHARIRSRPAAPPVVFVLGESWATWINPLLLAPLRAAPHAMLMPRAVAAATVSHGPAAADDGRGSARVWYGRMFLPPSDAVLHPGGMPFGQMRALQAAHPLSPLDVADKAAEVEAHAEAAAEAGAVSSTVIVPSGCGPGRRYLQTIDADGCLSNQILCWMSCVGAQLPSFRRSTDYL